MSTILNLRPIINLNSENFYQLCLSNPELQIERNSKGELIIMSPVGGESGAREADLIFEINLWNHQTKLGVVFSSSTIFSLPRGGDRSPDVAWVTKERWLNLTQEERERFPPICPDFVIELRSKTDRLKTLREKMREYLDCGLRLGWLINPQDKQVEIYRPGSSVELVLIPVTLSGENVLPGLEITLELNPRD